jgi:Anti-sigma-K factor rskA, C-terminal
MSDDPQERRAVALESPTAVVDDIAEQMVINRLRIALSRPAAWADAPDLDLAALTASERVPSERVPSERVPSEGDAQQQTAVISTGASQLPTAVIPPFQSESPTVIIPAVRSGPALRSGQPMPPTMPPAMPPAVSPARVAPRAGTRPPGRPAADSSRPAGATAWLRTRRGTRVVVGLLTAVVVLAISGFLAYSIVVTRPATETARFSLAGAGKYPRAEAGVSAAEQPAGWHLTMSVRGLPPAPAGSYYEAWLADGGSLVPLGTFHLRAAGNVELWSGVDLPAGAAVTVTIQRLGNLQPQDVVLTGVVRR